tara:strand:+ start:589 stop:1512 length:924 start_codon:yes stop_codon:yes gene_type:complete
MVSLSQSKSDKWTADQIPDQRGKIALITGSNSGLGYSTAKALARKGCDIILACRSKEKSIEAKNKLKINFPNANIICMELDLSDLRNVSEKANEIKNNFSHLDLLVNNAGIMHPPKTLSAQGYEIQFAVNHLAHMLLTLKLQSLMIKGHKARVITVTSGAQFFGKVGWDRIKAENYNKWESYANSKLANVMFALELHHKIKEKGVASLAAHPGVAKTNLFTAQKPKPNILEELSLNIFNPLFQSSDMGALPQLYAATSPEASSGEHYGPKYNFRGYPKLSPTAPSALNSLEREKLWVKSEEILSKFI